jgi:GTP-sensing pleiotropic transcriptional regulator CodY
MSDWSDFGTEVKTHTLARGPKCSVSLMLERLPDDARISVNRVLADRHGVTNSAIAKALRERLGENAPSLFSISNHRRGNCRCAS